MTPVVISFPRIIWRYLILNPAILSFNKRDNNYYYYHCTKDKVADIENILKFKSLGWVGNGNGTWKFLICQSKWKINLNHSVLFLKSYISGEKIVGGINMESFA